MAINSSPQWLPATVSNATTSSSDKTITIEDNHLYQIMSIYVDYTTNATVGARQLEVQLRDESNNVLDFILPGLTQAESLNYFYAFNLNHRDLTSLRDSDKVFTTMPFWVVNKRWNLRVFDNNAVDASGVGEDMIVRVTFMDRRIKI